MAFHFDQGPSLEKIDCFFYSFQFQKFINFLAFLKGAGLVGIKWNVLFDQNEN